MDKKTKAELLEEVRNLADKHAELKSTITEMLDEAEKKKLEYDKIIELNLIFNDSQKVNFNMNNFHLFNLMGDIIGIFVKNQYNINSEKIKGKIILDCGAHHGAFSFLCIL